jgi:hypothetical protein
MSIFARRLMPLFSFIALSACGTAAHSWAPNPGVDMATFPDAMDRCQKFAGSSDLRDNCMMAAGWHKADTEQAEAQETNKSIDPQALNVLGQLIGHAIIGH